ncbi:MAG: hypothetical protein Q7K43_04740 [Candidatus Woesearchaeota archaeon]|nr:hypothetical protein [Candidatus Woesearchaeota archaeon]
MSEVLIKPDYSAMNIDAIVSANQQLAEAIISKWKFKPIPADIEFGVPVMNYLLAIQASRELEQKEIMEDALKVIQKADYTTRIELFKSRASEVATIHGIGRDKGLIPLVGNQYCDLKTGIKYQEKLADKLK